MHEADFARQLKERLPDFQPIVERVRVTPKAKRTMEELELEIQAFLRKHKPTDHDVLQFLVSSVLGNAAKIYILTWQFDGIITRVGDGYSGNGAYTAPKLN